MFWNLFNNNDINMQFNNCNMSNIYVDLCTSSNTSAPNILNFSGPTLGDPDESYTYYSCINESDGEQWWYQIDWGDGDNTGWLGPYFGNVTVNATHSWSEEGGYFVELTTKDVFFNETKKNLTFQTESLPPLINSVEDNPDNVGFGDIVTITVNATDDKNGNWSGIQFVSVNISLPGNSSQTDRYLLNNTEGDIYQYNFSATWDPGQYNYSIFVMDKAINSIESNVYSFNVSANC